MQNKQTSGSLKASSQQIANSSFTAIRVSRTDRALAGLVSLQPVETKYRPSRDADERDQ